LPSAHGCGPARRARGRAHRTGRRAVRIGVAGLGLIGGSLALALRGTHEVTGYDTDERARAAAKADGIRIVTRLDELLPADAVLVATPIPAIVPALERLAPHADGAVLIDTGSLKRAVADYAARAPAATRIVGGHPMAGTTSAGFSAADPSLFRGRAFLLVATARSGGGDRIDRRGAHPAARRPRARRPRVRAELSAGRAFGAQRAQLSVVPSQALGELPGCRT